MAAAPALGRSRAVPKTGVGTFEKRVLGRGYADNLLEVAELP
ncbi:hypothetical protein AB0O07_07075 [Streptomyces sp. NPDC093085]